MATRADALKGHSVFIPLHFVEISLQQRLIYYSIAAV